MREGLQRFTEKGIILRERFSKGMILRSLIVFILSLVLFSVTENRAIKGLSGLGLIISGSIIGLFVLIFLIFYFLERSLEKHTERQKAIKKPAKKTVKKVAKKKTVAKKVVKKKTTKKKK